MHSFRTDRVFQELVMMSTSTPAGRLPLVLVGLCTDPSSASDWARELLVNSAPELLADGEAPKEFDDPCVLCTVKLKAFGCDTLTNISTVSRYFTLHTRDSVLPESYLQVGTRVPKASEATITEIHGIGIVYLFQSIPVEAEVLMQYALNLMHQGTYDLRSQIPYSHDNLH